MKSFAPLEAFQSSRLGIRWILAGVVFILILALVGGLWLWTHNNAVLYMAFALAITSLALITVVRFNHLQGDLSKLEIRATTTEKIAADANQRLAAVFHLSQKFVEANDDDEIISLVLRIAVDSVEAVGASFVPLDERGQPLAAIRYGDLPSAGMDAWVEYLASPAVRHQCGTCQNRGTVRESCPLVQVPIPEIGLYKDKIRVYCLPLRRGDKEFGILNLYLSKVEGLDRQAQEFLRVMLDETSLALEGIRLRKREIATLRQLQSVRRRADLSSILTNFLENVRDTLKADFTLLLVQDGSEDPSPMTLTSGNYSQSTKPFLEGLLQGVINTAQPMLLGDVAGDPASIQDLKSLIIAPLVPQDGMAIGAILSANSRSQSFNHRQLVLLQTLAGQAALVVQNSRLLAELEYKTVIAERTRLAREIHDGLAQTLGFLKLQTAQMQNYLVHNELEKLQDTLQSSYKILSEAFLDARHAIDGLRINPADGKLFRWLEETIFEFQENSGLTVKLEIFDEIDGLAPEVQAQLIRIVQEALSNIRKHAIASHVWVSGRLIHNELILEVRDDGCGFSPEDVPGASRYGLQGMRERSELIGAEFQVISRPSEGTIIRIRLPMLVERAA